MKQMNKFIIWPVLAILIFFLAKVLEAYPNMVEQYYSISVNKWVIQIISRITGIVNFSIGEFIYVGHIIAIPIIIISLLYKIVIFIKDYKTHGVSMFKFIGKIIRYVSIVYIIFMLIWGFNYSRQSIGEIMELDVVYSSTQELYDLNEALILKANQLRTEVNEDVNGIMIINESNQSVFDRASIGYNNISVDALKGSYGKPKSITLEKASFYTQITGLYFPFTAEANVNTSIPDMVFPATTLHEMAHQRGFASEGEANYIAYITSSNHPDIDFQYSGTVFALIYSMNALYASNPDSANELKELYGDGLVRDLTHYKEFWEEYNGFVSDLSSNVNDVYLKGNRQSNGVKSYGEMVDLLLAHYRKYGEV